MRILRPALLLLTLPLLASLAACGQKGPLYEPDDGIAVAPGSPAAPETSGPAGAPAPAPGTGTATGTDTAAPLPASPDRSDDRSDEPRKRIHTP